MFKEMIVSKVSKFFFVILMLVTACSYGVDGMNVEKPFLKAFINSEGIKYRVVVNGADVKTDKSKRFHKVEIPINQFSRSGENKLELQIFSQSKQGKLYKSDSAYVDVEFRLYTQQSDYVVLSRLRYSALGDQNGKPYDGSSDSGVYSLVSTDSLEFDKNGSYKVSDLKVKVFEDKHNKTFIHHMVNFPMPFPEWGFLQGENISDLAQYDTVEKLMSEFLMGPFLILENIHSGLSKKDVDSILPFFRERNYEMDMAFYYKPGTYEKMLKDSLQKEFSDGIILI